MNNTSRKIHEMLHQMEIMSKYDFLNPQYIRRVDPSTYYSMLIVENSFYGITILDNHYYNKSSKLLKLKIKWRLIYFYNSKRYIERFDN